MATAVNQSGTGNAFIDGVLSGVKWGGAFTYSFPTSAAQYPGVYASSEPSISFAAATNQQREATRAILSGDTVNAALTSVITATSLSSFISTTVSEAGGFGAGLNGLGDLRLAESPAANPTAYAYYPSNDADGSGGDVWFGTFYANTSNDFRNPRAGGYSYFTHIHELGHAIGLKHAHEFGGPGNTPVPSSRDAIEFTVMSYRTYTGQGTGGGYTFGQWDAPQTFMMYDILALQTMYGADYGAASNNTATTYRWNPSTGQMTINGVSQGIPGANKVFLTIWDGGGADTYDMSNYSTAVNINLAPGAWSITSTAQKANLGNGKFAAGNVYNALTFQGNNASLIEHARGGAGNDTISGNAANNALYGNNGNDYLKGVDGNDTLQGGAGADTMLGGLGDDKYYYDGLDTLIEGGSQGLDTVISTATLTLGNNLENLILSGTANLNGSGNTINNTIYGNSGANTLSGWGGNDVLNGGAGNDTLHGSAGRDVLTGAAGADKFDYNYAVESIPGAPIRDLITDFVRAQGDKIDLSTIDANELVAGNQAFVFTAAGSFSGAGQVRFAAGIVYVNTDGDLTAEMEIQMTGVATMAAVDFIL